METLFQVFGNILGNTVTMLRTLQVPLLGWSFLELYVRLAMIGVAFLVLGILFSIGRNDYFQDRNYERGVEKGYRKPGPRGY